MIPLWKLRREWASLKQQLQAVPERLIGPARQRRLDARFPADCRVQDGDRGLGDRVAIFLVFQPAGLSESCRQTCEHLARHGYAVLLVANHALRDMDVQGLRPVVWRFVQRPNFGYDFGGYRDGLTCLAQWGVKPDELLILNDSVWLPMQPTTDLLERLSAHPADIAGTILRTRRSEQFLESYLYRLNRRALTHPGFTAFWSALRLTSNKYHVIRRGERGFSAAMQAAGLRLAGISKNASP